MMTTGRRGLRATLAMLVACASVSAGGGVAQAATTDEEPGRTLEQALAQDLGMSMEEFTAAGAAVEAAEPRIQAQGDQMVAPRLGSDGRIQILGSEVAPSPATFPDLESLRDAYLAEVGDQGLTSFGYTADGYELTVIDPEVARERGRTSTEGPLVSPSDWAAAQRGVTVVRVDGPAEPAATVRGGQGIQFGSVDCSHGFNGWYGGRPIGISAGHCVLAGGTRVSTAGGSYLGTVDWWQFGAPGSVLESYGTDFATFPYASGHTTPASVSTYGSTLTITGRASAAIGMPVCKSGRRTGWTCSTVDKLFYQWIGDGSGDINRPKRWVWSLRAPLKVIPGDSGGAWVSGRKAVGVTSSYDLYPDGRPFGTAALLTSLDEYRPGVAVKIWLGRATSLTGATMASSTSGRAQWVKGQTVSGDTTTHSGDSVSPGAVMRVTVDGRVVATPKIAANGTWSFVYPASDSSTHTVTLQPRSGSSKGTTVTIKDGEYAKVVRHASGSYASTMAAKVAKDTHAPGVGTVYITSTSQSRYVAVAGARAGRDDSPLLLTSSTAVPQATRDALTYLKPQQIVIIGSTGLVSGTVRSELATYAPVSRIAGSDGLDTVGAVSATYPSTTRTVVVASSSSWTDQVTGGARAAAVGGPLLLTGATSLPASVKTELARITPERILVVGGTGAVSDTVLNELKAYAPTVTRAGGADPYAVSASVAKQFTAPRSSAWIVPDNSWGHAAGAIPGAAVTNAPVLVVKETSVPSAVSTALKRLSPQTIHIAGGTGTVSSTVSSALSKLLLP